LRLISWQRDKAIKKIRSQRIKVGELHINYFTGGQGEPLVVVHGGGIGAEGWLQSVTELCEHYRVYVPDLPGFGRSQPMDGNHDISEFVEFLEGFVHSLGLERFHLVGHSFGGGIALNYALKFPCKIGKLVLVSSLCLGREIAWWVRILSSSVLCRSLGVAAAVIIKAVRRLVIWVYAPLKFTNPLPLVKVNLGKSLATIEKQATVAANQLSELIMPTLLVWGARDGIVPVSQAYAAAKTIPDCQLHIFEGCGHSAYKQRLEEFTHLLTGFLL